MATSDSPENELFNDKLKQKEWLKKHDIPHAKLRWTGSIDELSEPELMKSTCVLKPTDGAAAVGVYLLEPKQNSLYDRKKGRVYSFESLKQSMKKVMRDYKHWSGQWLIEDSLRLHAPLYEYKMYMFHNKLELVMANLKQDGKQVKHWFDPNWKTAEVKRINNAINKEIPPPRDKQGITELAEKVSSLLELDFSRIDIFENDNGLFVGEINAWDGNPSFDNYWDTRLWQKLRQ